MMLSLIFVGCCLLFWATYRVYGGWMEWPGRNIAGPVDKLPSVHSAADLATQNNHTGPKPAAGEMHCLRVFPHPRLFQPILVLPKEAGGAIVRINTNV